MGILIRPWPPDINTGISIGTFTIPDVISIPIGLSYRLGEQSQSWIPGITVKLPFISLTASYINETPNPYSNGYYEINENRKTVTLATGVKVWNFMLDYSYYSTEYTASYTQIPGQWSVYSSETYLAKRNFQTHIVSTTTGWNKLLFTYAYRYQSSPELKEGEGNLVNLSTNSKIKNIHHLYGIRWQALSNLALGGYYNYLLDDSWQLVGQLYF